MERKRILPQSLIIPTDSKGSKQVGEVQAALQQLNILIQPAELARKELGDSTVKGIRQFQKQVGLSDDGKITNDTLKKLNEQLTHNHIVKSKTRTQRLQEQLQQLGVKIDPVEIQERSFGPSTEEALKSFQSKAKIEPDGRISEKALLDLRTETIKQRLSSKTQVADLHKTLLRALHIAKLSDTRVDHKELKEKSIGPSTQAAIKAIQEKYRLPLTGELDAYTYDQLISLATSIPQPVRLMKAKSAHELRPIKNAVRLNMNGKQVNQVQEALAFLGYQITDNEYKSQTYAKSTHDAVISFQRTHHLPVTGHVDGPTRERLNEEILMVNPEVAKSVHRYRVRGSVRNEQWYGMSGMKVQLWERLITGQGKMLGEKWTSHKGFYDIPYDPPRDPSTDQLKDTFTIQVIALDSSGKEIDSKILTSPTMIAWANFTLGPYPYRGPSEYTVRVNAVQKVIGTANIASLQEREGNRQISQAAKLADLPAEDVMRLVLAYLVAAKLQVPTLGPEACYSYISQNLPPSLPSELLDSTEDWELIDQLVNVATDGLVFMDHELQTSSFDHAISLNLIPIQTILKKDTILNSLTELKRTYALEKPILIGNGSLKSLIETVPAIKPYSNIVVDTFLQHRNMGEPFWQHLKSNAAQLGGSAVVEQFENVVHCGHITKHFTPMLTYLQQKMTDSNDQQLRSARDLAKLSTEQWVELIHNNDSQVPANIDGEKVEDRVRVYADSLARQSEQMFPDVALAATVARSTKKPLAHVSEIQKLLDTYPELNLRTTNVDAFFRDKEIQQPELLTETRVMQRVHRIAPTATVGRVMLDLKIHNSAQIVSLGKERFAEALTASHQVDQRTALTAYGLAEYQYAQVLQRIADFRLDIQGTNPQSIGDYKHMFEEGSSELSGIPDLSSLFGSLDFCDCTDCQSVYGAPAYLADILRFLDSHNSEVPGKTVKDLLFERRPDLGNIKLNCENTNTPLPYIDLVCEVLENAVNVPGTSPVLEYQTTRSASELRAFPENVRVEAYATLKEADYPMHSTFHLWQEEARAYLHHLGVKRWEIMTLFQNHRPGGTVPSSTSVAGEYWGLSTHETKLITVQENKAEILTRYWGFDATLQEISVADFMRHSRLDYEQLLDLLGVQWIHSASQSDPIFIERPNATCSTEQQKLVSLSLERLDRIHRFIRLWRCTGWSMWELDLFIRHPALGNGLINENTLIHLQQFQQIIKRLKTSIEQGFTLFGEINTEDRPHHGQTGQQRESLYTKMFLNPASGLPKNPDFVLPLSGSKRLSDLRGALLAAFAINERELELLLAKINDDALTLAHISTIHRYVNMARGLALSMNELLTFETITGMTDIFGTPQNTLNFIDQLDWVKTSGFTIDELDYLLQHNPNSPYRLQDGIISQHMDALREVLRSHTAGQSDGTIIDQLAGAFDVPTDQLQLLLTELNMDEQPLLDHLKNIDFVTRDRNGDYVKDVTPEHFGQIYQVYQFVHKVSMLLQRLEMNRKDLQWLLQHADDVHLLALDRLATKEKPATSLFPTWLSLVQWMHINKLYPGIESVSLRDVFDKAGDASTLAADLKSSIVTLTQWNSNELDALTAGLGYEYKKQDDSASDFTDIKTYLRLDACFKLQKRIGAEASKLLNWANRDDDTDEAQLTVAQQIKQMVKSKYDHETWLTKAASIEDVLREKKRDALVHYLIEASLRTKSPEVSSGGKRYANPEYFRDANDLLRYYFIDVEMAACQLTSRVKQAISSTQMYVQRCLMGLEQPKVEVSRAEQEDTSSENSWKQWKWMKNYRIWEANRKVFLYPENWIEPELRDDKSPFFKELEEEILQKDITDENVQAAFLNYVEKVHEVARLDIVGAYYELDDSDPRDDLAPEINIFHVIGRTRTHPAVYYYRQFDLNYGEWTAWDKIDLDIQSDQVIPVVYNRQLYLFWLNVVEKPQKVKKQPPAQPSDERHVPESPNQLEIQLAWSRRKDGSWTAKRVSKQKLVHPWQRPLFAYNLKPRYKSRENLLWMDIYISQSQEFNNTRFWDGHSNEPQFATKNRYHVNSRPWHSSSFVFDGEVVDVKMKGLVGKYHVLNDSGLTNDDRTMTNSYQYVHDNFGQDGRSINRLNGYYEIAPSLPLPDGMHYYNTHLVNNKKPLNSSRVNVLENGHTRTLLNQGKSPFEVVFSQHQLAFDTAAWGQVPFFYQDSYRSFFIKPEYQEYMVGYNQTLQTYNYEFYPFYHPYTALFLRELKRSGIDGLLNRRIQTQPQNYYPGNAFNINNYGLTQASKADQTVSQDIVDFERYGAYSLYNWEIFFHAPLMIACKLSANQRFEEAMRWFHYIFDPTNVDSSEVPQRYWVTRPFYEQTSQDYRKQRIEELLRNIESHTNELKAWKNNPFKPHLIARYRTVAYQKAVVMKYINNLIAWGDQLFRQDTIESLNEATTLYVLAYELLGRRPVKVPEIAKEDRSYHELTVDGPLDDFGNARIDILLENFTDAPVRVTRTREGAEPLPKLDVFYFSIPNNDSLMSYWDTVEDRLFKIRNCMNIDGVFRQLPLFEPPIDPALLVKAAAAGADLNSVLSDISAQLSPYRFERLAQKAGELCNEVRALGDKLLSVLESYDNEGLSLLRSSQEIQLQKAICEVYKQRIEESNETVAGLEQNLLMAQQKKEFYASREYLNLWEGTGLALGGASALAQTAIAVGYSLAGGLAMIPRFTTGAAGFGGSPTVTADPVDGLRFSQAAEAAVRTLGAIASAADKNSSLAFTMGSYERRDEEWQYQAQLAETEIKQFEKQILAAQIRLAIATKELENQEQNMEQLQVVDEYMKTKYTNAQLYDWQIKQVSTLFFQSYQLAYDMAKRAEQSYRYELGEPTASFIQFGYWDSLKKGLLSGERLMNDLRRMEASYLDQHKRDLEITKHISLAQLLPLSFIQLKETGVSTITLPEWIFDMDYPGHYRRVVKSVSISIPAIVGSFTSVNCTLSITRHGIRLNDSTTGGYGDPLVTEDERFYQSPVPVKAIATSHAQNDTGMFELNFNDQRFLPFEGAGAVSEWRIELPQENNQFDLSTIPDVILHIRYTSKASSNQTFKDLARSHTASILPTSGLQLLTLNQQFGTAWQRFLYPVGEGEQTLTFTIDQQQLPFYTRGKTSIKLKKVDLIVETKDQENFAVRLKVPNTAATDELMTPNASLGNRLHLSKSGFTGNVPVLGQWQLQLKKSSDEDFKSLRPDDIKNAYLVIGFETT